PTRRPAIPSPRQELGSARYVNRLLRIARHARAERPGPGMADFLAGFSFGADDAARAETSTCASAADLQLRLREMLNAKVTSTRAQHVATTLDISAAAHFTLGLSQAENDALEGLDMVDPSLGGIRSTSVTASSPGVQSRRLTQAADSLTNQPQDDPVLQRAVARHIISAVSATDSSVWVVRDMSHGPQGWDITYLCRDSSQQWERQNKGKTALVVGEFTKGAPDPTLMGRPAFDCRGRVKISFTRGSRCISVKYDHTPLHWTVAEAAELFRPPPRPVPAPDPRKQKTPRKQGSGRTKRDLRAQDENGNPRKRKKKNDGQAQAQAVAGEHAQQPLTELTQNGWAAHDLANGGVADGSAADEAQAGRGPGPTSVTRSLPINVSPEEAARRRDFAVKLLSNAAVDPDSLSTDQFNIFANQSPEHQNESLDMLVKYGAERLRIVHPDNRDGSASPLPGATTTPAQAAQAAPPGPLLTKELVSRSRVSGAGGSKSRKPVMSRRACLQCKGRKAKCPRQRPACSECQVAGLGCEYGPQRPIYKKRKEPDAMVPADDDLDDEAHPEAAEDEQQPGEEAEGHDGDTDHSCYPQVPGAEMLTPDADMQGHGTHQPQTPYFLSAPSLALPRPEEAPVSQQMLAAGSGLHQGDDDAPVHLLASHGQSKPASHDGLPINSPRMQDAVALSQAALEQQKQAASLPMVMQPAPDNFRTQSRRGRQGQATAPRGAQLAARSMDNSGGHDRAGSADMSDAPTYNAYGRYGDAVSHTLENKIGYEPYSYRRGTSEASPYLPYDYATGRAAASTMSMENQGMATMAPAYPSNTADRNSMSSARGHTAPDRTRSPYSVPGAARWPSQASASLQELAVRAATQPAQPGRGSMNQQQQQPAQGSWLHQTHGWYDFDGSGGSRSHAPGNQEPSYSWDLHDQVLGGGLS
ncbi:ATP-dependent DNA helicase II subunit 1, partial [Tolypocladium capitatum]